MLPLYQGLRISVELTDGWHVGEVEDVYYHDTGRRIFILLEDGRRALCMNESCIRILPKDE